MSVTYDFPHITHIDDVLPHVQDGCFKIIEKDTGHTFINYVMIGNDTFPMLTGDPVSNHAAVIRRECRGIAFNTLTGELVSRPFHKFFNVGERDDMNLEDSFFSSDVFIMDKVDGSMVRPLSTSSGIRWGTKMGVTDTALLAEEFVSNKPQYEEFAKFCMDNGYTPLFEFVSQRNRIVVDYAEDNMILLAIRKNDTGKYLTPKQVIDYAIPFELKTVKMYPAFSESNTIGFFAKMVRESTDFDEGVVLQWKNGHRVKIKTEAYTKMHRAKEATRTERTLALLIMSEGVDDLLPLLSEVDKKKVRDYVTNFSKSVKLMEKDLEAFYLFVRKEYLSKKDFAVSDFAKNLTVMEKSTVFALWDGKRLDISDAVIQLITSGLVSETAWDTFKQTTNTSANFNTFSATYT